MLTVYQDPSLENMLLDLLVHLVPKALLACKDLPVSKVIVVLMDQKERRVRKV